MSSPAGGSSPKSAKPGTVQSLVASFTSWRTAAVTLQSFPSGLPLGLVLVAIPAWLAIEGVDIKTIGFVTLAQAPWTFKFVWSPLMDRYAPPFLGRKRGWALLAQAVLVGAMLALALNAQHPPHVWTVALITLVIAFAGASQDIAIDAYAVEVLHRDEQGVAAGARSAVSRFAFFLSGRVVITATRSIAWPVIFALQSLIYVPAMALMVLSPEPESPPAPPPSLREAVWEPFVAFLRRRGAVQIAIFLVLYKFGDNLASALVSPFLIQVGFNEVDVGVASGTIGLIATIVGSIVGGTITSGIGLGHSLWLFGILQAFSNIGYVLIAQTGADRPLMYAAMGIEALTSGMGTGAFSVLLLRLTQKEFSATQYALLSSIFALGRTISGPIAGVLTDALGWETFFLLTIVAAAPGLLMLQRFAPFGVRDPALAFESGRAGAPLSRAALVGRAIAGGAVATVLAALTSALLSAMRAMRTGDAGFDIITPLIAIVRPTAVGDWIGTIGVVLMGITCGLGAAALQAAQRGVARNDR